MNSVVALCLTFSLLGRCSGNAGDAFGLINKVQTYCEYETITMGSKLADYYNSLDEATHKIDRMHIPFIAEHIGFGWDHAVYGKAHAGAAPTISGDTDVKTLQKKGGWIEDGEVALSAYAPLHNKWIYFYGDATLRQLASIFLLPQHGKEMENYKEMLHSKCVSQQHREITVPAGSESSDTSTTTGDSHHAPHHLKARTCNFPGFGDKGNITYDWKHLPHDEYDKWVFGPEGFWLADSVAHSAATATGADGSTKQFPDVMVIQIGHSTCLPASDSNKANSHLHLEDSVIRSHYDQVDTLFDAIKAAIHRPTRTQPKDGAPTTTTTVIVSLPGRVNLLNRAAERCVWKLNRIIAKSAHQRGFVVFEREEIEHRVGFKVESSEDLREIGVLDTAEAPTSHIVATALLKMISCLDKGNTAAVKP